MINNKKDNLIDSYDPNIGLSAAEVNNRLLKYGANEIPESKPNSFIQFLKKFWEPSSWMLELIIIISFLLNKYEDLVVVSALLLINACLSYFLERQASQVVGALKQRLQIKVRVLRDSEWTLIAAKALVPGDIIRIRAGDFIPADLMITNGELDVDQSAVTGESIDVHFTAHEKLISGSTVTRGEAQAVVESTGLRTQYAQTAVLIQKASPKLHIEQVVIKVVTWLFIVVAAMMVVVITLAKMRGTALLETVPILLILLMSAIPISLPVMFTVCLSVGAKDLSKHGVLVTRLSAVEDAATMSQLCIDKTGTITLNQLRIACVKPMGAHSEEEVISAGAMASQESNQDPIDTAFINEWKTLSSTQKNKDFEIVSFKPFDAFSRCTQATIIINNALQYVMKGAVISVTNACLVSPSDNQTIQRMTEELGQKGYRVLAVAKGASKESLELIGLVALFDPPRADAVKFIERIKDLGVSLKMLTGDALVVAEELASKVGLGEIVSFEDFKLGLLTPGLAHKDLAQEYAGFAEVFPEDKYTVVKSLQSLGFVTGMTGDGVNDAPALRQAEVGIAVSNSSDIARASASIVLTQAGLINIVYLIIHGRMVYQRLLTWIINKISRTILKTPYVAIAYVATGKFVVSAFSMLLLVLITDATKIALATDKVRPSTHPESWEINGFVGLAVVLGLLMLLQSLLLLWFGWSYLDLRSNDAALNTFSFLCMLYMAAFSIFSVRERLYFWSTKPGNILLISFAFEIVVGTGLVSYGLSGMEALPWLQTLGIFIYSMISCLFVNDFIKHWIIKKFNLTNGSIREQV